MISAATNKGLHVAVAILAILFAGCPTLAAEPAGAATRAILRVGVESGFQGFDPLKTRVFGISTLTAAVSMLETLIVFDRDGRVQPGLALTLTPDEDGLRWVAVLREDVHFHDGTRFDAAAVAFHFNRLLDPANRCACRGFIEPLLRVEVRDPLTAVFVLAQPWAALPAILAEPSVVSLIGSPAALAASDAEFNRRPVGTGPYRFVEWTPGQRLTVRRYEAFRDPAAAVFAQVEYLILPDQQTRFASLQAGDVDTIWTLSRASVMAARDEPALQVHTRIGSGARLLVFNTREPPLDDKNLRRALVQAADVRAYVGAVVGETDAYADDPFGPDTPFACAETGMPVFQPAEAAATIAKLEQPARLSFVHTATPRGRKTAQIFQQFWRNAGIEVELEPLEQVQLVRRMLKGEYQIGAWRIRDSRDPDADLYGMFHSNSPFNVSGLRKAALDELLVAGRQALVPAVRRSAYCDIARQLAGEAPVIYLARNVYYAISRAGLHGNPLAGGGILDVRRLRPGT